MKIAHVNIVTLHGNFADVDVLLENTALDVFAVTESRLDSILSLTVRYVLHGMFATEKIEIGTGEVVLCLSRVNGLASGEWI